MENGSQTPFMPPPSFGERDDQRNGRGLKAYLLLIGVVVVVGLILFSIISLFQGVGQQGEENPSSATNTPTPTVTSSPTPTPVEEELSRENLAIHVLNGNGESGASREASDFLEGLGYNVIQIGNAENFDFATTEIQIKISKSNFLQLLKDDLSEKYTVGSTSADLDEEERADVHIIIGAE